MAIAIPDVLLARLDVLANWAVYLLTIGAIIGNFLAGWVASHIGYRRAIATFFGAYFIFMMAAYGVVRDASGLAVPGAELKATQTATGLLRTTTSGPDGAWFSIQYSSDLTTWTSICTNQVVNGSIDFVDPDSQTDPVRFYRAVPELSPPAQ